MKGISIGVEKRAEPRYDFHHTIEYVLNSSAPHKIFRGVTVNQSNSGLCLYVFYSLNEGQEIIITDGLRVFKTGSVRWNMKIDDDIYKVGLRFV
ncbi:MAG: hypothetical protein AB1632_05285 [Nitrospirota bacterium]